MNVSMSLMDVDVEGDGESRGKSLEVYVRGVDHPVIQSTAGAVNG